MSREEEGAMSVSTILIVDDRRANRDYLKTLLSYAGHRLLGAADGAEALASARAERPDLIIADILMPTMDGFELVRQLRGDPAIAKTPVIFWTAHYHEREARALAMTCGVSSVITKPSEPETVLNAVKSALGFAALASAAPVAGEFDREHLRLLTDKLSQNVDALRSSNERLSALVELSLQLGSETDLRRLLQKFGRSARQIVGARYSITAIVDESGKHFRHLFTSGMDAEAAARSAREIQERTFSKTSSGMASAFASEIRAAILRLWASLHPIRRCIPGWGHPSPRPLGFTVISV